MKHIKLVLSAAATVALVAVAGAATSAQADEAAPAAQHQASVASEVNAAAYGPIGGAWSRTYYGTTAHIGGTKKPTIGVSWTVADFSSSQACVKARGYRWSDGKAYWVSLGCGKSGGASVHWGKDGGSGVAGRTAVKVKSQNILIGAPIYFTR